MCTCYPSIADKSSHSSFRYGRWLEETYCTNKPAEYLMLLLFSAAMILVCTSPLPRVGLRPSLSDHRTAVCPSVLTTDSCFRTDIYLESEEYTRTSRHPRSYTATSAIRLSPSHASAISYL